MRAALSSVILALTVSTLHAGELQRFWHDFPGFTNKLASYGYDRHFAASAQPEFVDSVIHDMAATPSSERLAEYICVLYYMDSRTVAIRLQAVESSSPATRAAVATMRDRLTRMTNEHSPPHKP